MGRPLNKKYFGNRNVGSTSTTSDNGIGGEGISTITQTAGSGKTGTLSVTIGAPQIPGGVNAVATATVAGGTVTFTVTEKGSGYTSAPTVTVTTTGSNGTGYTYSVALTTDSGNVGSSTNQENAIIAYAYIGSSRQVVDIVRQSGSKRYTVKGADGTVYRALLTAADSSASGEMDIYAYDVNNNTYYVTKLTERRARLTRKSGGSNYVYATGETAPWTFNAASNGYVKINNA